MVKVARLGVPAVGCDLVVTPDEDACGASLVPGAALADADEVNCSAIGCVPGSRMWMVISYFECGRASDSFVDLVVEFHALLLNFVARLVGDVFVFEIDRFVGADGVVSIVVADVVTAGVGDIVVVNICGAVAA